MLEQLSFASSATGTMAAFQPAGPTRTSENAFFQSLGTNGRTCFTCHQPAFGMSISVEHVNDTFRRTNGKDPLHWEGLLYWPAKLPDSEARHHSRCTQPGKHRRSTSTGRHSANR